MSENSSASPSGRGAQRRAGSIVVATLLAVGAVLWLASGQFGDIGAETAGARSPAAGPAAEKPLASVRVRQVFATVRERQILVTGRTQESRRVTLRAETPGPVAELRVAQGDAVRAKEIVMRQDAEDRRARLLEAGSLVRQREIEYSAARRLGEKGFRSETKIAEARARLDGARARAESIRIDIARTAIRAPFAGVLEDLSVDLGSYLKAGENIGFIVDLDPIVAVGFVSERQISDIRPGMAGSVKLIDGAELSGNVRFVGAVADPVTRSFRVELEVPNRGMAVRAGVTVKMRLPLSETRAYMISPAVLTLADDGRMGVRVVGGDDVVAFVPVSILGDSPEGVWVSGLADGMRLITVGHEFVKAGQKVRAVREAAEAGS